MLPEVELEILGSTLADLMTKALFDSEADTLAEMEAETPGNTLADVKVGAPLSALADTLAEVVAETLGDTLPDVKGEAIVAILADRAKWKPRQCSTHWPKTLAEIEAKNILRDIG